MSQSLLTVKELSSFLHLHPNTIYKWKDEGKLKYVNVNGLIRFKKEYLDDFEVNNKNRYLEYAELLPKIDTSLEKYDKMFLKGRSSVLRKNSKRWNYGFGSIYLRETKQGRKRWYIDYKANGKRIRQVVKDAQTRGQAVLVLREKVAETFNNKHDLGREKKGIKFFEFADIYLNDYAKVNKKSWKDDQYRIEAHMISYFGELELQDITPLLIEKYRAERLKTGITKSTVNREITVMKKMFNLAIDWNLTDKNPVLKVKLFSEKDTMKERILADEEEIKLLNESPDHLKPILVFALNTGMRRGEILNLRWEQIDLDRKSTRVKQTKSGKDRIIPINDYLYQELLRIKKLNVKSEYVFPNPETGKPFTELKKSFKSTCKRAGISNLRFHDLRHTFATRLIESGVDLITVRDLLGHFSVRVTQRYTHSNQNQKKKAVQILVKKVQKKAENSEKVAHICHIRKKEQKGKSVTHSYAIN